MYYQQHMSAGQAPPPQTVTSNALPHYGHPQPTLLQPGPAQYAPSPYPQYGYSNGLTSPQSAPPVSNSMNSTVLPPPGMHQPGMTNTYPTGMDTTGQIAPPGMKPRVTATLWEDEGSLCFQVEARGICVARREDNHMINGTKLLNVAGMTRGRRDGILKSEKVRHVVKIGPMHLKGVWIPFERALDFANKEKITEMLYPLFVHNIGALLYHPTNQTRTNQVMAAAERRKAEAGGQMRNNSIGGPAPPPGVLPSIQQHSHHHHMALPGPQPSIPSNNSSGRPSLDRAHTFPTPPTSASSVMGSMPSEGYQWPQAAMSSAQHPNPMSIDTSLSNARSMPATPATTPPGNSIQSMQQYPQGTQPYDNSRYAQQPQQPYATSNTSPQDRDSYGQNYMRPGDMAPPTGRPAGPGEQDVKPPNGMIHSAQPGEQLSQPAAEDEDQHETEYTHNSSYDSNRNGYGYNAPPLAPLADASGDLAGSDAHQAGSGRATPRTTNPSQGYYPQQTGYNSPPRVQSSSNLYNVMSNPEAPAAIASNRDVYASQDMSAMQNGYAAPPVMNGGSGGMKRGRDDEDERPGSGGYDMKRRKLEQPMSASFDPMRTAPLTQALRR